MYFSISILLFMSSIISSCFLPISVYCLQYISMFYFLFLIRILKPAQYFPLYHQLMLCFYLLLDVDEYISSHTILPILIILSDITPFVIFSITKLRSFQEMLQSPLFQIVYVSLYFILSTLITDNQVENRLILNQVRNVVTHN